MPLKSWACKKAKLLQAPKLLHVAPPISNTSFFTNLLILSMEICPNIRCHNIKEFSLICTIDYMMEYEEREKRNCKCLLAMTDPCTIMAVHDMNGRK